MTFDVFAFWRALLRAPRQMGAVLPAGRSLGNAMVREVLDASPGFVIEFGAGTGAITRCLFEVRDQFSGMVVFEKAPELAHRLQQDFPGLRIYPTCASQVGRLELPGEGALTVVSSLPFQSLSARDRHRLGKAIGDISRSSECFRLIQYSYFGRLPFESPAPNLQWRRVGRVLRNFPPATVWILENPETAAAIRPNRPMPDPRSFPPCPEHYRATEVRR